MRAGQSTFVRLGVASVLVALAAIRPVGGQEFMPPSPDVDQPLYQPTRAGLEHFAQDRLEKLIAGQEWTWRGHRFEGVRVHQLKRGWVTRERQANRDYSAPLRGQIFATLHVRVNGRVTAARVECNASYVWQPGGWAWEQVLLYLGAGDSHDFVTGKVL